MKIKFNLICIVFNLNKFLIFIEYINYNSELKYEKDLFCKFHLKHV